MAAQCPRDKHLCDECENVLEHPDCLEPNDGDVLPVHYCENFKERK